EVLILSIKERETPNGKIGMNFDLVVRNDLKEVQSLKETNGKFANRRVFTTEWKRNKNGSYKYELNNFMHYLAAVKVPEGTEIKDLNHLASLLRNKPVRVYEIGRASCREREKYEDEAGALQKKRESRSADDNR